MAYVEFEKLNLKDALDLAILIEEEAFERYNIFAEQLGHRYKGDASDFFVQMAGNEAKHVAQLRARRISLFGEAPTQMKSEMIWDVEAPGEGRVRNYMSPRQAVELALAGEVKAYQFFDSALKNVLDKQVKDLFIELRKEELGHQEMLKKLLSQLPTTSGADLTDEDVDEPSQQ
jgi:rubrerythrin